MEEYKTFLKEQIEINKANAIKEIEKGEMVPAMWSISTLIDLTAQLGALDKFKKENK